MEPGSRIYTYISPRIHLSSLLLCLSYRLYQIWISKMEGAKRQSLEEDSEGQATHTGKQS